METQNILNIAVDCGKFNTKFAYRVAGELKADVIRTSMRKGHDGYGKNEGVHQIEVAKEKYTIGDVSDSYSNDNTSLKKSIDLHRLVTLTAICQALKDASISGEATVNLSINIPITQYNNKNEREAIENLYKGTHDVVFDGEVIKLNIATVLVQFETAGIITKYRKTFADQNIIICDCGGLNVSRIVLRKGKIMPGSADLNECGSNVLIKAIQKELSKNHGIKHTSEDIMDMVREVQAIQGEDAQIVREVIANELDKITNEIVNDLKEDANLGIYDVFLCGGSSSIYHKEIAKKVSCSVKISEDSIFDNAKGVLILLEAYLKKQSA